MIASRRGPGVWLADDLQVQMIAPSRNDAVWRFGASIVNDDDFKSMPRIVEARESFEA
jgi:hypothetical protein